MGFQMYLSSLTHFLIAAQATYGATNSPVKIALDSGFAEYAQPETIRNAHITSQYVAVADAKFSSHWWRGNSSFNHGQMPYAEPGYQVFRNVRDFGAYGDGSHDDSDAINNAVKQGNRCWEGCTGSTTRGAVVYFPPGNYLIKKPINQYFFTEFIGDPFDKPVIIGDASFRGMALVDTNQYIPGGNGAKRFLAANNFYRQIRNFVFDTTRMSARGSGGPDNGRPTAIHWNVGQATSLQNIEFRMKPSGPSTRDVGIFMEDGSGGEELFSLDVYYDGGLIGDIGFVSDLTFNGGDIGFWAGNQQFTARGLKFRDEVGTSSPKLDLVDMTRTGVSLQWDWGFTWKEIDMEDCDVGFDVYSDYKPGTRGSQPAASTVILDSTFRRLNAVIKIRSTAKVPPPAITLDNINIIDVKDIVVAPNGPVLRSPRNERLDSWSIGRIYDRDGKGAEERGSYLSPAWKSPILMDSIDHSKFYTRSKPQYEQYGAEEVINVLDRGVKNDGTGDNTNAINNILAEARWGGKLVVFPAGIYAVRDTIEIPSGLRITGILWPQIMGFGEKFEDETKPRPVVRVGPARGAVGSVEISEILFTTRGPTAGAVLMEWNLHERAQGGTAMWDCVFRIGGAKGTDVGVLECPKLSGVNRRCMGASLLFDMKASSSGYFENNWFWVADHDIDTQDQTQIDVFVGRGVSIESQGPTWLYATSSEHAQMYQFQLNQASNTYLGHIQSETPYYQGGVPSTRPYKTGMFVADPSFAACDSIAVSPDDTCRKAWGLRILNSTNVYIYGGAFYSFHKSYKEGCVDGTNGPYCQDRLVEVTDSKNTYLYDLYTLGTNAVIRDQNRNNEAPKDLNQHGLGTAIAAWLSASRT